jgi:hypothetical protein
MSLRLQVSLHLGRQAFGAYTQPRLPLLLINIAVTPLKFKANQCGKPPPSTGSPIGLMSELIFQTVSFVISNAIGVEPLKAIVVAMTVAVNAAAKHSRAIMNVAFKFNLSPPFFVFVRNYLI